MAQTNRENARKVMSIVVVFLLLAGIVLYFRETVLHFCFDEHSRVQRWPHLSQETRSFVKVIFQLGGLLQILYLLTQLAFSPKEVEKTVRGLADALLKKTLIVQVTFAKVASWLRPGLKIPEGSYYAPGMRWREDGPLVALWVWVGWHFNLGQRMVDAYTELVSLAIPRYVPFPPAELVVVIPLWITGLMFFLLLLYWLVCTCICVGYLASSIVRGLWLAPKSNKPYGMWLRERVRSFNEWVDSFPPDLSRHKDDDSKVDLPHVKPNLSQYVRGVLFLALLLWAVWPAIVYLYALSLALWLLAGIFFILARISSLALKYGPTPRFVVLLGIITALLACWLGVM